MRRPSVRARGADIPISCVDSRRGRQLHRGLRCPFDYHYWSTETPSLQPPSRLKNAEDGALRLPCVTELFPELLDPAAADDNLPSCSVRMSLASQGLFVNDVAVRFAAQLLYELFALGRVTAHGVVVNLASKRSGPIEVDPRTWERMGFRHIGDEDQREEAVEQRQA